MNWWNKENNNTDNARLFNLVNKQIASDIERKIIGEIVLELLTAMGTTEEDVVEEQDSIYTTYKQCK